PERSSVGRGTSGLCSTTGCTASPAPTARNASPQRPRTVRLADTCRSSTERPAARANGEGANPPASSTTAPRAPVRGSGWLSANWLTDLSPSLLLYLQPKAAWNPSHALAAPRTQGTKQPDRRYPTPYPVKREMRSS